MWLIVLTARSISEEFSSGDAAARAAAASRDPNNQEQVESPSGLGSFGLASGSGVGSSSTGTGAHESSTKDLTKSGKDKEDKERGNEGQFLNKQNDYLLVSIRWKNLLYKTKKKKKTNYLIWIKRVCRDDQGVRR